VADTIGDLIDKLTIANVRLWHIEDARREYCAGPAKEEEKARGFLDKVAAVNRERNSLIDQINAAFKVLLDKMSGSDSSWVVSAEELLGFGKNKFYKEEA